jgi:hypothetical protein
MPPHLALFFFSASPTSRNSSNLILYFFVPALLILYFLAARYWIRARSSPGSIVTQYTPPQNLSPGALRYCFTGSIDAKAIAATVLHLAARGLVTFQGLDEYYAILRTTEPLPPDLPSEETAIYKRMFNLDQGGTAPFPGRVRTYDELPKDAFLLPPADDRALSQLATTFHDSLPKENQSAYFDDHLFYSFLGAFASLYFLLLAVPDDYLRWSVFVIFSLGIRNFVVFCHQPGFHPSLDSRYNRNTILLVLIAIGVAMFAGEVVPDSLLFKFSLSAVVVLNLVLPAILRTPTNEGRRLLDEITGYRNFLGSVEIDRMHRLKSPGWKPSQATANLAYAIALDLGDAWEEFLENAGFRSVIYERDPNGGFPKKRVIRTAPESAWVDHWSAWVAFAVAMLVLVILETLAMRAVSPK